MASNGDDNSNLEESDGGEDDEIRDDPMNNSNSMETRQFSGRRSQQQSSTSTENINTAEKKSSKSKSNSGGKGASKTIIESEDMDVDHQDDPGENSKGPPPPQTHLILYQQDTYERALAEYTRYLFFTEDHHGHGALPVPLKQLSHLVFMHQLPEDIEDLVAEYPNLQRLTILHVDHLPLEGFLQLMKSYASTLQRLELFCSPPIAAQYLDDRLLLQILRMRLTHLALPFDLTLINPDLPSFPLHIDVLRGDGPPHRRHREFYGAAVLYRPRAEQPTAQEDQRSEVSLARRSAQALYSMRKLEVRSLRHGRVLETSHLGTTVLYGRAAPVSGSKEEEEGVAPFPPNAQGQVVVEKLGLYLNAHLDVSHFRAQNLFGLVDWSKLTALDLDLPLHMPITSFFRIISKEGGGGGAALPSLTALRLADRQYFNGPLAYGHLFADLCRRDLKTKGKTVYLSEKLGRPLERLRYLTLSRFYFGRLPRVVRGRRRFEAVNIDTTRRAARRIAALKLNEKNLDQMAYDLGPLAYHTVLEVVLPFLAPNITSLHFEDCILDFGGETYVKDYLYRVFSNNWRSLRQVHRDNVLQFDFDFEELDKLPRAVENRPPEVYCGRRDHALAQMVRHCWFRGRVDVSVLLRIAHDDSMVVELPVELWTMEEIEDRARLPTDLYWRNVYVTLREANRRAVKVWGKPGLLPRAPVDGGEDVRYCQAPSEEVLENMEEPSPVAGSREVRKSTSAATKGKPLAKKSSTNATASSSSAATTNGGTSASAPAATLTPASAFQQNSNSEAELPPRKRSSLRHRSQSGSQ